MTAATEISGFLRAHGDAVKDLNDFAHVQPEQREIIEEAFSFALERPPQPSGSGKQ
jgi:hypothetical protein